MEVGRGGFFPSHSLSRFPHLNLITRTRDCDALKTSHLANVFLAQETRFEMKDKQETRQRITGTESVEYIFYFIVYLRLLRYYVITMSYQFL